MLDEGLIPALRRPEGLPSLSLLGDVLEGPGHLHDLPVLLDRRPHRADPPVISVVRGNPVLQVTGLARLHAAVEGFAHSRPRVWMHKFKCGVQAQLGVRVELMDPVHLLRPGHRLRPEVDHPRPREPLGLLQKGLLPPELVFPLPLFGHVPLDGHPVLQGALRVEHWRRGPAGDVATPVLLVVYGLSRPRLLGRHGLVQGLDHRRVRLRAPEQLRRAAEELRLGVPGYTNCLGSQYTCGLQ
jgi:hypothetical protein